MLVRVLEGSRLTTDWEKEAAADRSPRAHQYGSLWLKFLWLFEYAASQVVRKVDCGRALAQIIAREQKGDLPPQQMPATVYHQHFHHLYFHIYVRFG